MLKDVDESEARDVRALLTTLDEIKPWLKAITSEEPSRAWEVRPHSPLATDDRRTHPYRVSHRAWMAMSTAVDFLHCLQRSLAQEFDNRVDVRLHSYAQMGLIRGAVENACCSALPDENECSTGWRSNGKN
ncbi:hypothetical protein ACFFQW_03050 [Umezawaea endophytica]|uniref:Uncharacterized protein n=1 Tax=Umezawaea endophytica TaxID=1654476 RepID=A0A9X2VM41_9PSEU|nr:hypothetical protein [Umezawaea endophytica]MCS7479125.1 hypothetical protein [Umezawaea endophytica]